MNQFVIQGIGFIGLLFHVIAFQKNKRSFTLLLQMIATLFIAIHFSLLFAWTAVAMNILAAARAFVFQKRDSWKKINSPSVMYLFVGLFLAGGLISWQGLISLLPMLSMTLECFALWSNKTKNLRLLFLSARPGWVVYNYAVGSWAGLAIETFLIASLLIAMFRFDRTGRRGQVETIS